MSEEEKKAIEIIKKEITKPEITPLEVYATDIKMLLHIIDKQQKEIEELKEYKHDAELTKVSCCTAQNCEALNNCIKLRRELQNADKKIQKQQEKIKELTAFYNSFESGEIVNYPIFKQRYISKDKIRAKIKELEDNMILFTNHKEKFNRYKYARNTLEKLLKENNND
jgi:hypothetical protein